MTFFCLHLIQRFITEMSKNISFRNRNESVNEEQLGMILPTFVLCLRDFSLELVKDGKEITPDAYLEDCLKLKPGNDNTINKYNRPRECILKYFPKRKCFVFDRPCGRKDLQKLECVPSEKLSEEFIEETNMLTEYIYACEAKVLLNSKPINGRMFVTLLKTYMESIRKGAVPDVDDAFTTVANFENEQIAAAAVREFARKLEMMELPMKTNPFEEFYQQTLRISISNLRAESVLNAKKYEQKAIDKMNAKWERTKKKNAQEVRKFCETVINCQYALSVGPKMRRGDYHRPGGFQVYRFDMDSLNEYYWTKVREYDTHETREALFKFAEAESVKERNILISDKFITDHERQREIQYITTKYRKMQYTQKEEFETARKNEKMQADKQRRQMEMERKEYKKMQQEKLENIEKLYREEKENSRYEIKEMSEQFQENLRKIQENQKETERKLRQSVDLERCEATKTVQEIRETLTHKMNEKADKARRLEERLRNAEMKIREEAIRHEEEMKKTHKQMMLTESKIKEMKMMYEKYRVDSAERITYLQRNGCANEREIQTIKEERDRYRRKADESSCLIM